MNSKRRLPEIEPLEAKPVDGADASTRLNEQIVLDSISPLKCGEMAEWLKAHAWKACIPQGIQGSNPCLSAITF